MVDLANWTPRQRPGLRALHGQLVRLEPLDWVRHGQGLFAAVAGERNLSLWDYMPFGPFPQYEPFEQMLNRARAEQGWETLVIVDAPSTQVLGMASYMRIREEHGSAEVGCVAFGDRLKRTPQATEALLLMAAHVFRRISAIAATNGSATTPTWRQSVPQDDLDFRSRACFAMTW